MKVWFISRHPGAMDWAKAKGLHWDEHLEHWESPQVGPGDRVYGTLPVNVAAQVCSRGAEYWHLQLDLDAERRGRELSAAQLGDLRARFVRFHVQCFGDSQ